MGLKAMMFAVKSSVHWLLGGKGKKAALEKNTYLIMREMAACGLGCFANQWFCDTFLF